MLAMLVDIPKAVALPGRPSRPYLKRVTQANHVVPRGAEIVNWQCLSDGSGRGGKYAWVDSGEFIPCHNGS